MFALGLLFQVLALGLLVHVFALGLRFQVFALRLRFQVFAWGCCCFLSESMVRLSDFSFFVCFEVVVV